MNIDTPETSSSPEPVSAPLHANIQHDTSDSRSATESPGPGLMSRTTLSPDRSGTLSQTTSAHKPTDADHDASARSDTDAPSGLQRSSGNYDIVTSIGADGEKLEYGVMPGRLQPGDAYAPSMGYDHSNIRVSYAPIFKGNKRLYPLP